MSTRSEKWPKKLDLEKVPPQNEKCTPLLIKRRPNQKSYRELKKRISLIKPLDPKKLLHLDLKNPSWSKTKTPYVYSTPYIFSRLRIWLFITLLSKITQTSLLDQTPSQSPPVFKYPQSHPTNTHTPTSQSPSHPHKSQKVVSSTCIFVISLILAY